MKIVLLLFLMNGIFVHDVQVAFFKIHQENDNLEMQIIMEKEDVESTFKESSIHFNEKSFQDYLDENIALWINKEKQILCLDVMEINEKHISMICNIHEVKDEIESLEINNTCLLNINNHSNIIEIRLGDSERDFLMNKKRTSISVTY